MADQMRDPLLFGFEPEEISGSFTAVLPFCVLFAIVFAASSHAWSRFSLSTQDRGLLSSSVASLAHGVPSAIVSLKLVWESMPIDVDSRNAREQQWLLQYSLAYMLCDTILYLVPYTPTDFIFIAHHAVAMFYLSTAQNLGRGGISCVFMLLLGECTSLLQNAWYICRTLEKQNQVFRWHLHWLRYVYPISYVLVRTVVGPPAVLWLCWQLLQAKLIPTFFKYSWVVVCLVSLAGSQLWSLSLVKTLITDRRPSKARRNSAARRSPGPSAGTFTL